MPDLAAVVRARIAAAVLPPPAEPARLGEIDLLPHQREAAGLLRASLARHGGALLSDPVGTGKTFVALAVASSYAGVCVVAPAALRSMWQRALARAGLSAPITSIESLSRRTPAALPRGGLVIVDEAHHARNPATRRYAALARLAWGHDVLLLSATPVHNRPRDLRALCALFLGESAASVPPDVLARVLCRRLDVLPRGRLPRVTPTNWLELTGGTDTLRRIVALPPPVPPRDGVAVHVLGTLGLARQWCSSDAALLAALDRRLTTACALESRLAQGAHLTRRELARCIVDTGVVQLALPLDTPGERPVPPAVAAQLREHVDGVRTLRDHLLARGTPDEERFALLDRVIAGHRPTRLVCFSHSVETALAVHRALAPCHRCALLAGRITKVASGRVTRDEVIDRFSPARVRRPGDDAMRIDVLVATDVLSEGVDLHDAGVLVHLDLPWTMARLEQRIGRLRRIGAAHDEVVQYAFRPPHEAEGTVAILRRLAAKAGITRRQLGVDPCGFTFPAGAARGRRARSIESPADAAERLRRVVRAWAGDNAVSAPGGDPYVAAVASSARRPAFIAVVEAGAARMVLGGIEDMVSADPGVLADLCSRCTMEARPVADAQRRLAARRLLEWCRLEGTRHTIVATGASESHRRALRLLASMARGRGRSSARGIHEELNATRALVMRSVGAGAERFLDEWLRTAGAAPPSLAALRDLRVALEARVRPASATGSHWQLAALLLLVPRK